MQKKNIGKISVVIGGGGRQPVPPYLQSKSFRVFLGGHFNWLVY